MFDKYKNGYDSLWKAIIRPPRENYTIKDLGTSFILKDQLNSKLKNISLKEPIFN